MQRRAKIVGSAVDAWGDTWDVREARKTQFGFDVLLGWPAGIPRGKGGSGGPRVIITADLAGWCNALRGSRAPNALPIGATALKRVRRLLGYHGQVDRVEWWETRADDLADMTTDRFCEKHHASAGAVSQARIAVFGRRVRETGWWRKAEIAEILLSPRPSADIADQLGVAAGAVRRMRSAIAGQSPDPPRAR